MSTRYVTVADLKDRHDVEILDHDRHYRAAIIAAEAAIDNECGRSFDKSAATPEFFRPESDRYCVIRDALGIAKVEVSGNGRGGPWHEIDEYITATARGGPVERLESETDSFPTYRGGWLRVTPKDGWGWESVPEPIKEATLLQAAKLFKRKDSPEGAIGFEGTGVINVRAGLDPDAWNLIRPYTRLQAWLP